MSLPKAYPDAPAPVVAGSAVLIGSVHLRGGAVLAQGLAPASGSARRPPTSPCSTAPPPPKSGRCGSARPGWALDPTDLPSLMTTAPAPGRPAP
jgi:hypothetical protein